MLLDAADSKNVTRSCRKLLGIGSIWTLVVLGIVSGASGENFVHLRSPESGSAQRIQTRLKAEGKLLVGVGDERRELPLKIAGELRFVEKPIRPGKDGSPRALRHYQTAKAHIAVDGHSERTGLSKTRRLIAVDQSEGVATFYSPLGPMTRDDLELVDTQCDPLLLREILPPKEVKVGGQWRPSDQLIAGLFGLDTIDGQDVLCKLTTATADRAVIQFAGVAEGKSLGAKSKLKVDGEITFHRGRSEISRVNAKINEQRDVGDFAPGFEIDASIESTITPTDTPVELTEYELAGLDLERTPGNSAIDFASPSMGLGFIHDRRWRVTLHRRTLLVLRMVEDGKFIAQCNISPAGPAVEDADAEMTKFQGQIAQSIGKHGGQIDEVSRARTAAGIDIVRIAASGKNNDALLRWIYYLLTGEQGARLAVVFTLPDKRTEPFAAGDHDLIGGIRFPDNEKTALQPAAKN